MILGGTYRITMLHQKKWCVHSPSTRIASSGVVTSQVRLYRAPFGGALRAA